MKDRKFIENDLDNYQKYLKEIKKYDPLDTAEYLFLTTEMNKIITENDKLSDTEVLELTQKLDAINNTEDYTEELFELTKEVKQIVEKYDIPKINKVSNPKKMNSKISSRTGLLPKISTIEKKVEAHNDKNAIAQSKKEPDGRLTLKQVVEKNTKEPTTKFDTTTIRKIRSELDAVKKPIKVKKKTSKIEKTIWTIIFMLSLLLLLFLILRFVKWQMENEKTDNQISYIYDVVNVEEVANKGSVTDLGNFTVVPEKEEPQKYTRPNDYWYYMSLSMMDVNLGELKKINKDTIGWIWVPGTNVNYPYVHTTDNSYYLNHSFTKGFNYAGWVFQDYRNNPDIISRNNIIYAHGRLDNTMFGSLKRVITPSWYNNSDNYIIKTSTEKYNALWQVFSTYTILPESYYIKTSFNDEQFETYLNTISSRSVHDYGVSVNINDKILTLSSCYDDSKRVVVHAKLIRLEEK